MPSSLRYVLWWLGGCCVRDRWGETEGKGGRQRVHVWTHARARARARAHTHTHTGNQALFDAVTRQGHDKYVRFLSSLDAWLK